MSKIVKKLLGSIEENLSEVNLEGDEVTLTFMVFTSSGGATRSGHLRLNLKDVLEAITLIDRRITKVRRIERELEELKKKRKAK